MTIDELISRAAAQPVIQETREVRVPGPILLARLGELPRMTVAELIAHPDRHLETQTFRHGHLLGPGVSESDIRAWQAAFPDHPLPEDLRRALVLVNGVHFWANLSTGRAYFGIAPIDEWENVAGGRWGAMFDQLPTGCLLMSYHDNGDYYLILETSTSTYRLFDLEDISNPKVVGRQFSEVLDWFWSDARSLDPRIQSAG